MRLQQIANNLLSSALKHGPGKPVELGVPEIGGDKVRFNLRDHGIGIAPEPGPHLRALRVGAQLGGFGLGL